MLLRRRRNLITLITIIIIIIFLVFELEPLHSKYQHEYAALRYQNDYLRSRAAHCPVEIIPILMPVCGRPEFLEKVIKSLNNSDNIECYVLVVGDDCSNQKVLDILHSNDNRFLVIVMRHLRPFLSLPSLFTSGEYATSANIYSLLSFAFDKIKAPAAIVLESDIEPSRDMLNYFEWAFEHFLSPHSTSFPESLRSKVLSINAYSEQSTAEIAMSKRYHVSGGRFNPWGWLTSRKVWLTYLRKGWTSFNNWDIAVQYNIRIPNNLICINPILSRSKHLGYHGENYKVSEEQYLNSAEGRVYLERNVSIIYSGYTPILI